MMIRKILLVVLVVLNCGILSESRKLPAYIKKCEYHKPDITECAVKHGNEAIPLLVKGEKNLGIPPLNPLKIPFLQINYQELMLNMSDISVRGAENFMLSSIEFDDKTVSLNLTNKLIEVLFHFNALGKISTLPFKGSGHGTVSIINLAINYKYEFKLVKKNQLTYATIIKDEIYLKPQDFKINYQDEVEKNRVLSDSINKFVNENWRDMFEEFSPLITDVLRNILTPVVNNALDTLPMEEVFPDW